MRKMNYLICLIGLSCSLQAQNLFYDFTETTATYADLTGTSSINGSEVWNFSGASPTAYYAMNINSVFSGFQAFDIDCYNLRVYGGEIEFFDPGSNQIVYISGLGLIYPDGLKDKGTSSPLSPISYVVSGTFPNKILKIEWKNAGLTTGSSDYINLQIWIYQATKAIEVHYGSSSVTNASTTAAVLGLGHTYVPNSNVIEDDFLSGTTSNPVLTLWGAGGFTGVPANGAVYKYSISTTTSTVSSVALSDKIQLYPTPASSFVTLKMPDQNAITSVRIQNSCGQTELYLANPQPDQPLDVSSLHNGLYYMQIETNAGSIVKKLVIDK